MTSGRITVPDVRQPRLEYRRTYQCELTQTKEVTPCVQWTKRGSATLKAFSGFPLEDFAISTHSQAEPSDLELNFLLCSSADDDNYM